MALEYQEKSKGLELLEHYTIIQSYWFWWITSALDQKNEEEIMKEIDDLAYNCTKIIISHKIWPWLIVINFIYLKKVE